ncbi:hypothetical protein D9V84_02925 [Bacteroidetes/Chlorobi group bacterium Naka2016]|jgi:hypothetical protein|nr:MAG: hypothetical protein D9V84_02925 [Bacteroidetes/Chlorobi group bacterium Naka2016]
MNIKNINISSKVSNISQQQPTLSKPNQNVKDTNKSKPTDIPDKLQISNEARRMQEIKGKIESGFYNSEKVQLKTSEKIYQKYFLKP